MTTAANTALRMATRFWFAVTIAGQLVFASYIAILYGRAAARGDFEAWNAVMTHGYVPGDAIGNVAVAAHLVFAIFVIVGGALQLVPWVRRRARALHRWVGRAYVVAGFGIGAGGLYMGWVRGSVGDLSQHVAISVNAALVMICAVFALRHARARDFGAHRRWALRLFLVMSGVWFFRVGLMAWLLVNGGPVGFDPDTFTGPFLTTLGVAQYVVPLAVLELYLRVQTRGGATGRLAMAACLVVLTLIIGIGIVGATMGMWLPRL